VRDVRCEGKRSDGDAGRDTARQGPQIPRTGWIRQPLTRAAGRCHRRAPAFFRLLTVPLARFLCLHLQNIIARAAGAVWLWGGEGTQLLPAARRDPRGASVGVGVPPPRPTGHGDLCSCRVRGAFPGSRVPARAPRLLSQHRLATATTGDTSGPHGWGQGPRLSRERPGARISVLTGGL